MNYHVNILVHFKISFIIAWDDFCGWHRSDFHIVLCIVFLGYICIQRFPNLGRLLGRSCFLSRNWTWFQFDCYTIGPQGQERSIEWPSWEILEMCTSMRIVIIMENYWQWAHTQQSMVVIESFCLVKSKDSNREASW